MQCVILNIINKIKYFFNKKYYRTKNYNDNILNAKIKIA